jgi:hypothetical protein
MSKVKIEGNASGTGTFTIAAPNSNTDRTFNLPDEAGTVLTSASDIAASQIVDALNATGSAPIYACRAWVNFNGTGTVAIRASGNVSSITDNGTGNYSLNFTNAMPDNNFCAVGTARIDGAFSAAYAGDIYITAVRVQTFSSGASPIDTAHVFVSVFR